MRRPFKEDLPHSEAGHNPIWCGGDMDGQCIGDDPCWACIGWAFSKLDDLSEAIRQIMEKSNEAALQGIEQFEPKDETVYLMRRIMEMHELGYKALK